METKNKYCDGYTIAKYRNYTRESFTSKLARGSLTIFTMALLLGMFFLVSHAEGHVAGGATLAAGVLMNRGADPSARTQLKVELDKFKGIFARTKIVVSQSYLRDDVVLSGTNPQQISWTITAIQTATNPTVNAVRLQNNDAFLITKMGVYIYVSPTTSGLESVAQQAQGKLFTYPNAVLMPGAGDVVAVQSLYNGWIYFKEESTVYFEKLKAYKFYRVGEAQEGLQISQQAAAVGTNGAWLRSEWEDADYGMMTIHTPFRMTGKRSYTVQLNLNPAQSFLALSGANGKLYATLILDGFLATGGEGHLAAAERSGR